MTQEQFITTTKTWINNKIILSQRSNWYKIPQRRAAIFQVQAMFGQLLLNKAKTSAGQIAILLKRHEALLETILPIPSNPSYENSFKILKTLINEAENIINTYNLNP